MVRRIRRTLVFLLTFGMMTILGAGCVATSGTSGTTTKSWTLTTAECNGVISVHEDPRGAFFSARVRQNDKYRIPETPIVDGVGRGSDGVYECVVKYDGSNRSTATWGGHDFR